jgi:hypothetical protein
MHKELIKNISWVRRQLTHTLQHETTHCTSWTSYSRDSDTVFGTTNGILHVLALLVL